MLNVTSNIDQFARSLSDAAQNQLPFALALALNDTAADVIEAEKKEMVRAFDRPTRFTLNAFTFRRAAKTRPMVQIKMKPFQKRRHYLKVQARGGARPNTGLERQLQSRLRYSGIINTVTPAGGARLDSYGNWQRGQANQVLSAVQAQRDSLTNTTSKSRSRNRRRSQFFVPREGSRLSAGVWERTSNGQLRKILHFSDSAANYTKRFNYELVAKRKAERVLPTHLARRLAQAWESRRR